MVSLTEARTHNFNLKNLAPGLVAVFVGGTSGIGLYTAREFVRNTNAPHVYLIGRNQTEATRIIEELNAINPSSQVDFIKKDVSLLRNVDEACKEITEKEKKVNLLFMTVGYFTFKGRDETSEGLDRKLSCHYYARMRFISNFAPLLTAAAQDPEPKAALSRAVCVLDPSVGKKTAPNFSDLSLKSAFSLRSCSIHASAMQNFALEHFAKEYPRTSFIHAFPSIVDTGVARDAYGRFNTAFWIVGSVLFKPWMVEKKESGERHLFAATAPRFAPRAKKEEVQDVAVGADDVKGSGAYHVNWDGEAMGDSKKMASMRAEGAEKKIWEHTEEVFRKICDEGGKY
ncbi:hypothetical protein BU26DRAFT_514775 [Trematosphaeria pertusa]|uniref:NAD(P)-binding protein n=1 Tax=Trematosphaeria pertusa TaxID=390896 RepID=A0A6A6J0K9_9PLEO|nr:uncharacterized protein BU26DRAFT_514775 [Trematosphaeria pertusa]KAF2254943.1 hypothetical protein BU26DRAFT_514775 [Trematosphaeria pertusa]